MTSADGARSGVIYTRLSKVKERDRQSGNEDINTAEQEAKLRGLAALRDITVAGPAYTDNDLTAYKGSARYKGRTGFDAMLKRLRAGDIRVILVCQIYRLYRSHSDLERLIEVCKAHDISIHTVSGGDMDLSTATGQMIAEFLASVGKQEVALMTERATDGKARIRAAGRWPGGRVPYGYRVSGEFTKGTGTVAVDEDEAEIIRGMCAGVIAGKSLWEIARRLDAGGVPRPGKPVPGQRTISRNGCSWDPHQVRLMVTNPRYAALVDYKGEILGPAAAVKDGGWPAIISRGTREKVTAALDSRPGSRKGQRGRKTRWLLSGIARCGKCGSQNMRVLALANGRRGYSCRACYGVTRDAMRVNEMAEDKVKRMLRHPAFAAAFKPRSDVAALNTRREEISKELEEWAATRTTARAYRIATEPLYSELDRIEEKLTEAYRGTGLEDIAGVPDPAAKWDAPPPAGFTMTQKRAIVRALIDVTILPIKNTGEGPSMMGPEKGWKVGDSWFRPESVRIEPRKPA